MATAQRTKNTIVLQRDVLTTVAIRRPLEPLPQGLRTYWGSSRISQGRTHFNPLRETQKIRISYTLTQDQGMLQDLAERATRNRSGSAQRGPATADARGIRVDLSGVPAMVRAAANLTTLKRVDGPLAVKVKLQEPLEPSPLICVHCKQHLEAHEHVTDETRGSWTKAGYDADAPRTDHYWFCTSEPVS